ncbi:MAG: hypothetical protein R3C49_25335 [Planctomycetaceae bacterium]
MKTYVADLAGSSNLGRALNGQLTQNRPGYTFGLELEVPLGNRAAKAKFEQRQWELKRSINVFRATVEKSLTDVEIARREVATAWSEIVSRYHSMMAADQEAGYLLDRFTVLPASEDSATLLLEDLLDSFERRTDEEAAFVKAQVDHATAVLRLKKEMGILLQAKTSRPDVESEQQQWMNDRLQAAVRNLPRSAAARPVQVASGAEMFSEASSGADSATELLIQPASHSRNDAPMPQHRTTWTRPGRAQPIGTE